MSLLTDRCWGRFWRSDPQRLPVAARKPPRPSALLWVLCTKQLPYLFLSQCLSPAVFVGCICLFAGLLSSWWKVSSVRTGMTSSRAPRTSQSPRQIECNGRMSNETGHLARAVGGVAWSPYFTERFDHVHFRAGLLQAPADAAGNKTEKRPGAFVLDRPWPTELSVTMDVVYVCSVQSAPCGFGGFKMDRRA